MQNQLIQVKKIINQEISTLNLSPTISKVFLSLLDEKIKEKGTTDELIWIAAGLEILNAGVKEHYLSDCREFNVLQKIVLEGDKLYALGLKYIFKYNNTDAVKDVSVSLTKISECFTNGIPDTFENIYKAASLWGSAVSLSSIILQAKTDKKILNYDKIYEASLMLGSIYYFSNSQNESTRLIMEEIKKLFKDNYKELLDMVV